MRPRILVAAGVATVALVTAGTVVVLSGPGHTPVAPAPSAPATAEVSACGLPGTPGVEGATSATWTTMAGWPLPASATDGPGVQTPGGVRSCFAHTQSGAVLAAYTIALLSGGIAEDWRTVVQQQTMPGPGQAVLLGSVPNASPDTVTTPRGFDVAAYTADRATVRYRLTAKGQDYACALDVQWSAGDWRLLLADDGGTSTAGCVRGVPETFIPWGPS